MKVSCERDVSSANISSIIGSQNHSEQDAGFCQRILLLPPVIYSRNVR